MSRASSEVWSRVGFDPEARLRWLLDFGSLKPASLTDAKRSAAVDEVRARGERSATLCFSTS